MWEITLVIHSLISFWLEPPVTIGYVSKSQTFNIFAANYKCFDKP